MWLLALRRAATAFAHGNTGLGGSISVPLNFDQAGAGGQAAAGDEPSGRLTLRQLATMRPGHSPLGIPA
jgi:hypothetical protein